MKKFLVLATLCLATPALAQTTPAGNGQNFAARKAEILQKMQQRQQCVQAAATPEAMRACAPKHGERGGEHGTPGAQ